VVKKERKGMHAEFWWEILADNGHFEVRKGKLKPNVKTGMHAVVVEVSKSLPLEERLENFRILVSEFSLLFEHTC
jgi:hypothetical protein